MADLETTDLFRGAFFMCMGGDLEDIRLRKSGQASFLFTGHDLHEHDKAYINGHAVVNPVQFREALNRLRDILFERLRDKERYDVEQSDYPFRQRRHRAGNHRQHQNHGRP